MDKATKVLQIITSQVILSVAIAITLEAVILAPCTKIFAQAPVEVASKAAVVNRTDRINTSIRQ